MDWAQTSFQPVFLNGLFWGFYRTPEEQREWERQYPQTSADVENEPNLAPGEQT